MYRFLMAVKAAILPIILGIATVIGGAILLIKGLPDTDLGLMFGGALVIFFSFAFFSTAVSEAKDRLHAICPECQKFMGKTDKTVNYSYEVNDYKDDYDKDGKLMNSTFIFTCTIECPHCGNTIMFNEKIVAKTLAKANTLMNARLRKMLKLKR